MINTIKLLFDLEAIMRYLQSVKCFVTEIKYFIEQQINYPVCELILETLIFNEPPFYLTNIRNMQKLV